MDNYFGIINQLITFVDFIIVSFVVFKNQSFAPLAISTISTLSVTLLIEVYFKSLNDKFIGIFSSIIGEKGLSFLLKLLS